MRLMRRPIGPLTYLLLAFADLWVGSSVSAVAAPAKTSAPIIPLGAGDSILRSVEQLRVVCAELAVVVRRHRRQLSTVDRGTALESAATIVPSRSRGSALWSKFRSSSSHCR